MNYRRIPIAVLRRNPELYYNFLYPDLNKTISNDNTSKNENLDSTEGSVNIPMPNEEQDNIGIKENSEAPSENKKGFPQHRSYKGIHFIEFVILVLAILMLISVFDTNT